MQEASNGELQLRAVCLGPGVGVRIPRGKVMKVLYKLYTCDCVVIAINFARPTGKSMWIHTALVKILMVMKYSSFSCIFHITDKESVGNRELCCMERLSL